MKFIIKGKCWCYGENIDTDAIAPMGSYQGENLTAGAKNCLRDIDPTFAKNVRDGDIFVATKNLGIGSSREAAPLFLKTLGIRLVLASSFARIFFRNCYNVGLPALICQNAGSINMGDELCANLKTCDVSNLTQETSLSTQPIPEHLFEMVVAGGLLPHLKNKLQHSKSHFDDGNGSL